MAIGLPGTRRRVESAAVVAHGDVERPGVDFPRYAYVRGPAVAYGVRDKFAYGVQDSVRSRVANGRARP